MSAEATIRKQARECLKHNYSKAIIGLLIALLPLYIIDGSTTAISCALINAVPDKTTADIMIYSIGYTVEIVAAFFFSPVINGYIRAYYTTAYTSEFCLSDLFYYFQKGRYKRALKLNLAFFLRMLLPALLFYMPLIVYEIISSNLAAFYDSVLYHDFFFMLAVLSSVCITLYAIRYFTVYTVTVDNEQLSPKQAFEYSRYIMKDKTGSAAKLIFSFTPWMLLCLLVLPMLYVIPYMTQSLCIGAKWMTKATFEVN